MQCQARVKSVGKEVHKHEVTVIHKNITYHYAQKDHRTELYYFRIIFGNSCSVITEPNCFWNYLVSVISVSRGLLNL